MLFYNLCNIFFNKNLSLFGSAIFGDGVGAILIAGDDYKKQVTKHLFLGVHGWKIIKYKSYVMGSMNVN